MLFAWLTRPAGLAICPLFASTVNPVNHPKSNMKRLIQLGRRMVTAPSPPRKIRADGFITLDPSRKIEEENMVGYEKGMFYPAQIGEVFRGQYQILSKLGFGAFSTVWFCRDLRQHQYAALKINISGTRSNRETYVLEHLASIRSSHPGKYKLRTMRDSFEIEGPAGTHKCLVHEPLITSLLHFQASFPDLTLAEDMLKPLLCELLVALDYLHSEALVVHTDIQAKNIMLRALDLSVFGTWEAKEYENPSPRKVLGDRTVYQSPRFNLKESWMFCGMPLLCDFGEARIGNSQHEGLIQPKVYRAPEVVLGMKWSSKVDIWNLGVLIWDLFEGHPMFDGRNSSKQHSDAHLLAEMVALLGTPPLQFRRRSEESSKYWDETGNWKQRISIPKNSLEDSEVRLEGDNKLLFLQFMRKMLKWVPEERYSASELLKDAWLTSDY